MKKVLLASTALVAFAGAAAAEVTLSGSAKMAIVGGSGDLDARVTIDGINGPAGYDPGVVVGETVRDSVDLTVPSQFFQDVDVDFTLTGETDNGLSFGANVDLDEAGNLGNEFDDQGVDIFLSGAFGTVTLGDTDSAMDAVLWDGDELAGGLGSINDANTVHAGFNGSYLTGNNGDGQRLAYSYDYESFGFVVSLEQGPTGANGLVQDGDDDLTWSVGGSYDWDFGGGLAHFGLAYTYSDDGAIEFEASDAGFVFDDDVYLLSGEADAWGITAAVELDGGFSGGLTYVQYDFKDQPSSFGDIDYLALGAAYTFEEFSIGVNWGEYSADNVDFSGFGVAMVYDLGGGLEVQAGYGQSNTELKNVSGMVDITDGAGNEGEVSFEDGKFTSDFDQWSLGLSMAF